MLFESYSDFFLFAQRLPANARCAGCIARLLMISLAVS